MCVMIIIASVIFTYHFSQPKIPLENDLCKSTINFRLADSNHNFEYNIFLSLNFTDAGKGYEHIRGAVIKDEKKYTLARTLDFSYQIRKNSNYEITINDVKKLGQDDMPEDLVSQYLYYTLPDSLTFLKINEINKHLVLISGLQGPVFICSLL